MRIAEEEYLEHYGILGMKWGVRRTPEQLGHREATRIKYNRAAAKVDYERNRKKKRYQKPNRRYISLEKNTGDHSEILKIDTKFKTAVDKMLLDKKGIRLPGDRNVKINYRIDITEEDYEKAEAFCNQYLSKHK